MSRGELIIQLSKLGFGIVFLYVAWRIISALNILGL